MDLSRFNRCLSLVSPCAQSRMDRLEVGQTQSKQLQMRNQRLNKSKERTGLRSLTAISPVSLCRSFATVPFALQQNLHDPRQH